MIRIFSQDMSAKSLLLAGLERVLIVAALVCGTKLRYWNDPLGFDSYTRLPDFGIQALVFVAILQICLYYSDCYDLRVVRKLDVRLASLGQAIGAGSILLAVVYYVFPTTTVGRGVFLIGTLLAAFFTLATRVVMDRVWRVTPKQNILILGTAGLARTVAEEFENRDDLDAHVAGFVPERNTPDMPATLRGVAVLNGIEDLEEITRRHHISRIIVAIEERRGSMPVRELVRFRINGIRVEEASSTLAALTGRVWLSTVRPSWFVFGDGFRRSHTNLAFKRMLDLIASIFGLIVCLPVMALVAMAVRLDSRGPVIFRQTRIGLNGRSFELFKFRSMREDAEEAGGAQWAQENDPRVTRVGNILRRCRLDELPQFINVIRGDMSFVGPRPERPVFVEQLRREIAYYDERHSVRPGITGWAQVQYQYGSSIEDAFRKLEYDLFYLQNMSVSFDLGIILRTIRIVLSGRGGR
jgi:sugar transferase (PEP-CTERM system associated)